MRLDLAQAIGERLLARFDDSGTGVVAGSVRRCKPEPRDIEILLPWHPADDDPVYHRIAAMCPPPAGAASMCDQPTPDGERWFQGVKGLKPGFRYAQLLCLAATDPRWAAARAPDFKIDLFRFDPGPTGNFGWVMLQRTGPAQFGEACLAKFKQRGGGGSRDGYLIDLAGNKISTPTELDAFRALGVAWVDPCDRVGYESIKPQDSWHDPIPAKEIPF